MIKLKEGAGAGYTVAIKELRARNVELAAPKAENGDLIVSFKADIVPESYEFKAEGYDWSTTDEATIYGKLYGTVSLTDMIEDELRTDNNQHREMLLKMYSVEAEDEKESFKFYSGFLNRVLAGLEKDWLDATNEDIKFYIERDSYDIKTLRGVGYVFVPAESPMEFRSSNGTDIFDYDSGEHYSVALITSAVVNSEDMCEAINDAHNNKDYDYEDYEQELEYERQNIDDVDDDYSYDDYEESLASNKKHMREDMSDDGEMLYVYSSSKDTDLFKYYFSNTLEHGLNASSAYGLGTYAVMEPPFDNASIGYASDKRDQIYGDNCFKFRIPTRKIFFLNWSDYQKTGICKELGATREDFIEKQLDFFQIDPKVKNHIEELVPLFDDTPMPEDWDEDKKAKWQDYIANKPTPDVKNSSQAQALFRLMSRYYYQNKRGSLRTPIAGFVYTGQKDGRTYVGWNAKAMIPEAFTNDLGETWQECDKTAPEYIEYVQKAESFKFDANNTVDADRIFDGNRTAEKEGIYRLFMKFNSSDDESDSMAGGVFQNIVIHDDKTVDCKFKSNYTQYDLGQRCVTVGTKFMQSLYELGYKFGNLDAGLRFGHETVKVDEQKGLAELPAEMWPEACTGGLRLAGQHINKETMNIPTHFGDKTLLLIRCCIEDDCFDGWNVNFKEIEKKDKQCFTPDEETWNKLREKYEWMEQVAKTPLEKPTVKRTTLYTNKMNDATAAIEAAKADIEAANASGDAKALAKAEKALAKAEAALDDSTTKFNAAKASAEASEAKALEKSTKISNSWKNHVDRVKAGWVNESLVNKFFEDDCGAACADACSSGAVTSDCMSGFTPENPLVKKDLKEGKVKADMENRIDEIIAASACPEEVWAIVESEFDDAGIGYLEALGFPRD